MDTTARKSYPAEAEVSKRMTLRDALARLAATPLVAEALPLLFGLAYIFQSFLYAHTRQSIEDEGGYLYKGWLFATGQYEIFQDFGPWSNHMPLSFYVPGYVQMLFGPGLRTGRYLAIFWSVLMLLGLYLLVRRLRGRWWAFAAVGLLAINPAMIKIYSAAISQGMVACLFVWMLFFILGEQRTSLQLALGGVLSGLLVLTRLNMVPAVPLVLAFIFWQHGRRAGLLATSAALLTLVIGHALFWPGILRMWAYWLPESLAPFLEPWRPPAGGGLVWNPNIDTESRILSFFQSLRVHFVVMVGTVVAFLLWPARSRWPSRHDFRAALLLAALFITLLLAHIWATLFKEYCVFCLAGYVSFFSAAALLLVVLSVPVWLRDAPAWRQLLIAALVLVAVAGVGFGAYSEIGPWMANLRLPEVMFPRSPTVSQMLNYRYDIDPSDTRRFLPGVVGLAVGLLVLLAALFLRGTAGFFHRKSKTRPASFGFYAASSLLILGVLLTPTLPLGGYPFYECDGDVIAAYERTGAYLREQLPDGAQVYWKGGLSTVPLLYAPQANVYPPLLNSGYTRFKGGDPQALARYGYWNDNMARAWLAETDYVLIEQRYFGDWVSDVVTTGNYEELQAAPPTTPCRTDSQIRIFRRIGD